jgi:hypothetical protein
MTKINALLLLEESEQQQGFLIFISLTIVNFLLTLPGRNKTFHSSSANTIILKKTL